METRGRARASGQLWVDRGAVTELRVVWDQGQRGKARAEGRGRKVGGGWVGPDLEAGHSQDRD